MSLLMRPLTQLTVISAALMCVSVKANSQQFRLLEKDLAIVAPLDGKYPVRVSDKLQSGQEIFPENWYRQIEKSFEKTPVGKALSYENERGDWKFISARVAPCSPLGNAPSHQTNALCWPELRIVWQPIVRNIFVAARNAPFYADDRAVHTLYDVPVSQGLTSVEGEKAQFYLGKIKSFVSNPQPNTMALTKEELAEFVTLRNKVTQLLVANTLNLRSTKITTSQYSGHGIRPEYGDLEEEKNFKQRLLGFLSKYGAPSEIKALTAFSLPEGRDAPGIDEWIFLAFQGNKGDILPEDILLKSHVTGKTIFNLGPSSRASMLRDDEALYDLPASQEGAKEINESVLLFQRDSSKLGPLINDRTQRLVPNTTCASCHKLNGLRFDFHNLSYLEDREVTISGRVTKDVSLDMEWLSQNLK
jgi:hypothetical protein